MRRNRDFDRETIPESGAANFRLCFTRAETYRDRSRIHDRRRACTAVQAFIEKTTGRIERRRMELFEVVGNGKRRRKRRRRHSRRKRRVRNRVTMKKYDEY